MVNDLPVSFETKNLYNSKLNPSALHSRNTGLCNYFMRYLLQKAMSVFKWKVPEEWDLPYFLYTLYIRGHLAILETREFGVIPQECALGGYNVFYRPSYVLVTNPLIYGTQRRIINEDCTVIKLTPDYAGIMDLVTFYADQLALCAESVGMNLVNTRVATVFPAANKNQSESYKKIFDQVASGDPAVVFDKSLLSDDGKIMWQPFSANVKQQYIVSDILSDMKKIENQFDTEIGIPNANTDKRERLISDEVNANNVEVYTRSELWMDTIRKEIDRANAMFNLTLAVDWRYPEEVEGGTDGDDREQINDDGAV